MKLYQNKRDRFWNATQADAQKHKREIGGEFELVDVPGTGRQELADFLNHLQADAALDVEIAQGIREQERPAIPLKADPAPEVVERFARDREAHEIEDFILNRATVAQVERIFAAMGTRFAENRKG